MSWVCIRKETEKDRERLEESAKRFCKRHSLKKSPPNVEYALYAESEMNNTNYLRNLWKQCVKRAYNEPSATGSAWGYIGHSEKT